MRWMMIALVLTILVIVYGGSNFVVISRIVQSLPDRPVWRWTVGVTLTVFALAYIAGRFLEKVVPCSTACPLIWIGSVWFAILTYSFLIIAAGDLGFGLAGRLMGNPDWVGTVKDWIPRFAIVFAVLISAYGAWNAMQPHVTTYTISVDKSTTRTGDLSIVALTDVHMGHIMGASRIRRLVDEVNKLKPDIVLLGGDVVDEDIRPVMEQDLGRMLKEIHAPLGIYAATGNHEFIGGVKEAVDYLESEGIVVLRDRAIRIDPDIWIVGRDDRAGRRMGGPVRKDLEQILDERTVDANQLIILMDHQPHGLEEGVVAGADIQISGHTHNGQLWPFNHITGAIFELDWGYIQKQNTHVIVSCGAGTWGPPVKVGSVSEIVQITVHQPAAVENTGEEGSTGTVRTELE